jgi:hypothetical protein
MLALLGVVSCHGDCPTCKDDCPNGVCPYTSIAPPANGVAQFTVIPTTIAAGLSLTALGGLNPPGHTVPSDHDGFYDGDQVTGSFGIATSERPVYVPATAALIQINTDATDSLVKFTFRATENFYFTLGLVIPSVTLTVGQIVTAGTLIGHTAPGYALDFGAFDMSVTHTGFLTPARYPTTSLYYVSPWKYFPPTMQAQIYPQVYRAPTAPDKDGKIDYSVAGELVGDWFLQGMPADSSYTSYGWSRTVTFVYDSYDPSLVRIAVGGTIGNPAIYAIDSTGPRPETVTPASGMVAYRLYYYVGTPGQTPQLGLLLVQMTDAATIKIELFAGSTTGTGQFDANASVFVR